MKLYNVEVTGGRVPYDLKQATPAQITDWVRFQLPGFTVPEKLANKQTLQYGEYQVKIEALPGDESKDILDSEPENLPDPATAQTDAEFAEQKADTATVTTVKHSKKTVGDV